MSLSSYFQLDVTFQKGTQKETSYYCNVTLKCCNRKDLVKEDVHELLETRFSKKFDEGDYIYTHKRIAPYDHAKLHDDGYENFIIKINKKEIPESKEDKSDENQHESTREIQGVPATAKA